MGSNIVANGTATLHPYRLEHLIMVPKQQRYVLAKAGLAMAGILSSSAAQASLFAGETLDMIANGISWVVLVIAPLVAITIFWLVHILPERIAEKRRHPQTQAIKVLCLLSLFFGGMLWPLAWLWAYSKPVLYKMAYGTDVAHEHHGESDKETAAIAKPGPEAGGDQAGNEAVNEIAQLRERLRFLESRLGKEERG